MQANRPKLITAAVILGVFLLLAWWISSNRPQPERQREFAKPLLQVESQVISATPYQFRLSSFGTVQPRTQSLLVAQVSGQIIEVNPAFRDGGFFSAGDVLIRIDDRDYRSAVKVARANVLQAQLALEEEKAKALQAERDWIRLGDGAEAPALVLRKPQLAAAEAQLMSAQANLEKAELDLERTHIRAPYDGRILATKVDLGQYVNSNSALAEVFATDVVEIRLPLKNSDLEFIDLPENYRGKPVDPSHYPAVTITSNLGTPQQWSGRIVRTEAALDSSSHQLYVVAQIQDPFAIHHSDKLPLKIGQYVTAEIQGKRLQQALVIPTKSLYQGSYVYAVDSDNLLRRRDVSVAFQTPTETIIATGLDSGTEVVISPLGQVASGTRVNASNEHTAHTRNGNDQPPRRKTP